MKTSTTITTIAPLLLTAQKQMGDVKKGAENPFFKSSYADLNSVREVSIPLLNSLGISVLQPTIENNGHNYVETILLHTSGEFVSSQTEIKNSKGTAQDEGSGISYARRYGLQSLLNIGAVDDDAETAMGRTKTTKTSTLPKHGPLTPQVPTTIITTLTPKVTARTPVTETTVEQKTANGTGKTTFKQTAVTEDW